MKRYNIILAVIMAAAVTLCVFCCCVTANNTPASSVMDSPEPVTEPEPAEMVEAVEPEPEQVEEPEPEPEPEPPAPVPVSLHALYYCHACGQWTLSYNPLYAGDELMAFLCDGCLSELRTALEVDHDRIHP